MLRQLLGCLPLVALLSACGCTGDNARPGLIGANNNVKVKVPENLPPATLAASTRVDYLGRQILKENPDIGLQPLFVTIGVPDLTVFHCGAVGIYISEGVVNRCSKPDGAQDPELAAVICSQLGKMVSEYRLQERNDLDRDPPFQPQRIGSGTVGNYDPTNSMLAEQAYFEQKNPRHRNISPVALDPNKLAQCYMSKAGYNPDVLVKIAPMLQMAEANPKYESQLNGPRNSGGLGIGNNP